jgi:ABC-type multidrug transport system ATPase subunit
LIALIVLVLDEPTEGIQHSIIKDMGRVIRMLVVRNTMAMVVVDQYCDFAAELTDQYRVMARGEIVKRGGVGRTCRRTARRHSFRLNPNVSLPVFVRAQPPGQAGVVKRRRPRNKLKQSRLGVKFQHQ